MGTDVPSFLVNDVSIPQLNDIPRTPGTGGYGPYPSMGRKARSNDESVSHDESEHYYTASSPSDLSIHNRSSSGNSSLGGNRPAELSLPAGSSKSSNSLASPGSTGGRNSDHPSKAMKKGSAPKTPYRLQNSLNINVTPPEDPPAGSNQAGDSSITTAKGVSNLATGTGTPPTVGSGNSPFQPGNHPSSLPPKSVTAPRGDHGTFDANAAPPTNSVNIRRQQTLRSQNNNQAGSEIPWNHEDPREWTNERVIWWLETNNFSSQWITKFKELNISGERLFALVSYSAVKTLGILESPYRFVKLLRSVVPHIPAVQPAPSPIRVSPNSSPSNLSPSTTNQQISSLKSSDENGPSGSHTPTKMNPFLASSRRTSFEKYLFLDNHLRPRRTKPPGPSILVTSDGSDFKLVSINEVESGGDVRKVVYEALFSTPPSPSADLRALCALQLTDYFCRPGAALTDAQLWQILSAAAGDIVKFHVNAKPPQKPVVDNSPLSSSSTLSGGSAVGPGAISESAEPLVRSNETALALSPRRLRQEGSSTPGWNVSSEEALSPPGTGPQPLYPQTPSYLTENHNDAGNDYFNYPHGSSNVRPQTSSSSGHSVNAVGGALFNNRSRRNGSVEQLVALRTAPKPPLARSLSSKYRPELSPVSSSPPSVEESSKSDDEGDVDDEWADAPQLDDSSEDDNSDTGLKYVNGKPNSESGGSAGDPTSASSPKMSSPRNAGKKLEDIAARADSDSGNGTSSKQDSGNQATNSRPPSENLPSNNTHASDKQPDTIAWNPSANLKAPGNRLPQLVIPRTSSRGAQAFMDHNTIVEESEDSPGTGSSSPYGLKPGSFNKGRHKPTLSESSMDSPRSPGAAMLEQATIDWASRPPAEVLYENLERFFPNTDLDKPVVVSRKSPSLGNNEVLQKLVSTPPLADTPPPPDSRSSPNGGQITAPRVRPDVDTEVKSPHASVNRKKPDNSPSEEREEEEDSAGPGTASISRAKSIRVVAREASRRLTQRSREPSSHLLRRKSTKMWGQRVVEMRKGTPNSVTLRDHKQYVWIKGELIGRGSFGKVYLGLNATTGDMMAVKQVKASRVTDAGSSVDDSIKALYAEVENMKDLDHLNIVQYLGFQRLDRVSNLFLEYVPGGSVNSLLRNFGRFPDDTIRFLNRQVLEGLSYLHSRGILHRDLKADNLLLDIDGTIKISDFGISKRSRDIYTNNAEMSMQGTIFWMAPEVIHNVIKNQKQGYSAKVDVWSLGCVILEMYVGRRPWSTEEAIGAMYKLGSSKQAPPIPEDAKPHVSPEGKDFLDCCFVIDPKKRQTASELKSHKFNELDPNYNFATSKLAIDMNRSVKRTSKLLKTQQK